MGLWENNCKVKFIQNTCCSSWFLCKEWKQFTLSEATLGRHLCSTNHVVIVWDRGSISLWYRWKWLSIPQSVVIRRGTEIVFIYALFQNSQGKSALYFIRFISTEKWVGCKHFKSYIFEVLADKHGQVAGDSMTRSRPSSGGSWLQMKAQAFMGHFLYFWHYKSFGISRFKWELEESTNFLKHGNSKIVQSRSVRLISGKR